MIIVSFFIAIFVLNRERMKRISSILFLIISRAAMAQFAPQAPNFGHEGIHVDSLIISAWATHCDFQPGWLDAADTSLGKIPAGNASLATGKPNQNLGVISLGDAGVATLTFDQYIVNGQGPDFVVFENGFANPLNKEEAFLELAFVEVSSDGEHFVRFPAYSNTSTSAQSPSYSFLNASHLHNLAGKYIYPYGTAFDLEDLKDSAHLDISKVTHVRIIDVVGVVNSPVGTKDSQGNWINDPYPTAFPAGGFDLNGVGLIHHRPLALNENTALTFQIYPNPCTDNFSITLNDETPVSIEIFSVLGQKLDTFQCQNKGTISMQHFPAGIYFIRIKKNTYFETHKIIKN